MAAITPRERRRINRIRYDAQSSRPLLHLYTFDFPVVDLSEGGAKFSSTDPAVVKVGSRIGGALIFQSGQTYQFTGVIIRVDADGAVVQFTTPLPQEAVRLSVQEKRAFFRLRYPVSERPTARVVGRRYEVVEVSERGLVLHVSPYDFFSLGEVLSALLTFSDGVSLLVRGKVYRVEHDRVVLLLSDGIPSCRVRQEERLIIQRFKNK